MQNLPIFHQHTLKCHLILTCILKNGAPCRFQRQYRLEALLKTYNLTSVVNFPTHTQKHSATAIDNIFIDISKTGNYSICPTINGLSDHDAQSVTLHFFNLGQPPKKCMSIRKINEHTINDFLNKLSYETWDTIFSTDAVNNMFNSLDSYLKIFYSIFFTKEISHC